jgi:PPM family protein phosphatase
MDFFAGSDIGRVRSENEDSFLLCVPDDEDILLKKGALAIVADGVGGGPDGKLASSMAVEIIRTQYYNSDSVDHSYALLSAMQHANNEIFRTAGNELFNGGMSTTCTAVALVDGKGHLCHAGDSRAYLLHSGEFRRISKDHTLVEDLVDEGIISKEEAANHPQRNIIVKALGFKPDITPDVESVPVEKGDTLFLCSDGVYGCVSDEEIVGELLDNQAESAGNRLIALALERGGKDNITLVILKV